MRYMKNKSTGCIFPFDQKAMDGNADLAECTAAGTILGRNCESESVFYDKIASLRSEVADKDMRIEMLEQENRQLHNELKELKKQVDPANAKRDELKSSPVAELRKKAADLGINTENLSKSQLIGAIVDQSAKEE